MLSNFRNIAVLIFAYNRAEKLKALCSSICNADGAASYDYFLFIDGPKSESEKKKIVDVAKVAENFLEISELPVHIKRESSNKGLKNSVIDGIRSVLKMGYGSYIVLEDDIRLSPVALDYFRDSLLRYENDNHIGTISAFIYPLNFKKNGVFRAYRMCSWGWASWSHKTGDFFINEKLSKPSIYVIIKSALAGFDILAMYRKYLRGELQSWAVPFQIYLVSLGMKTVYPMQSLLSNDGFEIGTHSDGFSHNSDQIGFYYDTGEHKSVFYALMLQGYLLKHYLKRVKNHVVRSFLPKGKPL